MKKKLLSMTIGLFCALILLSPCLFAAADPGKPDTVTTESVKVKPGNNAVIAMKALIDDSLFNDKTSWVGVGSMSIPLKYDTNVFKIDSVKFAGSYAKWDEKFTNPKIDTGFVSFGGIYDLSSGKKPPIYSPDSAETMAHIFITINKAAKPGKYFFELTKDPIQRDAYFGSPNGMTGWKPVFVSGAITVEK